MNFFLKIKFLISEKIVDEFKLKNTKENENLFTVGLLSAIKYEDVRIELCKEILSNPGAYNETNIGTPHLIPIRPTNKTDDPKDTKKDDPNNPQNPKKPTIDPEKERQDVLNRKNNFRLKFDKKFTKDCPKKNKTIDKKPEEKPFNDDPPVDPIPPIEKPEVNPLPINKVLHTPYKDDAIEELWDEIRPILETLKHLKSINFFIEKKRFINFFYYL